MNRADIVKKLPTDKHRLDDELETQAVTQYEISAKVADLVYEAAVTKDKLKQLEAEIVNYAAESDVKYTVKQLESLVLADTGRRTLAGDLLELQKQVDLWQGLLDAWRQKGFALKVLADLSATDYYAVDSTTDSRRAAINKVRTTRKELRDGGT